MNLGFFYSCYREKAAVEYSVSQLYSVYPEAKTYLVSDGGLDFSYLEGQYSGLKFVMGEDTMSRTFDVNDSNFQEAEMQKVIRNCAFTVLDRLMKSIEYLQSDYVLMLDPDALVRGPLSIPDGAVLLGSQVNRGFPRKFKKILKNQPGGISINAWGATPAIFHVETFQKAYKNLMENAEIFDALSWEFKAMYAHDVLLPTIFALIGERETPNPELIECLRDPSWRVKKQPLVHQFRDYYPRETSR